MPYGKTSGSSTKPRHLVCKKFLNVKMYTWCIVYPSAGAACYCCRWRRKISIAKFWTSFHIIFLFCTLVFRLECFLQYHAIWSGVLRNKEQKCTTQDLFNNHLFKLVSKINNWDEGDSIQTPSILAWSFINPF